MFETEYREVFSQITASEETHRRILTMKNEKRKTHGAAIASKLLIAAVMLSLLVVTASATGFTRWFADFFAGASEQPLTQEQMDIIEEKTQTVGLSQSVEGYTISLKEAITDGGKTYIALAVTAPEGTDLTQAPQEGYTLDTVYPELSGSIRSVDGNYTVMSYATSWREDGDGKANTMDMVLMLDSYDGAFAEDIQWQLSLDGLTAYCRNTALEQQLAEKYAGQDKVMYTDEESAALYAQIPLVRGSWNFTFRLENDSQSRELLTAPATARAVIGYDANGQERFGDVTVTSIVLRELSVTISYDAENANFSYGDKVYLAMKDGSEVTLHAASATPGAQHFYTDAPISPEEVTHLILPNGTKLPG